MFPRLETDRLILRPFTEADLPTLAEYRSDPEVARHQSWDAPYSLAQAEAMLERMRLKEAGSPGAWHQVAIELKAGGELVGDCAFCVLDEDPPLQAEIGFTLAPGHQGRGYATEAVSRLLDHLFLTLKLHRVRGNCDVQNSASARLMDRVGMRCEAHFVENAWHKGRWSSELHFAILAREWISKQQGA